MPEAYFLLSDGSKASFGQGASKTRHRVAAAQGSLSGQRSNWGIRLATPPLYALSDGGRKSRSLKNTSRCRTKPGVSAAARKRQPTALPSLRSDISSHLQEKKTGVFIDEAAGFIEVAVGLIDQADGFIDQADGFIDQAGCFIDQAAGLKRVVVGFI